MKAPYSTVCLFLGLSASIGVGNSFLELSPSLIHRDRGAEQMTLSQQLSGALATGSRRAPVISKDDTGGTGSVVAVVRPTVPCGTDLPTVEGRIGDCAQKNPGSAFWDGIPQGHVGQGEWRLVSFDGTTHEVWRDERTLLLWASLISPINWCRATGSSGGGPYGQVDPSGICNNGVHQSQVTPVSACVEAAGLDTPDAYDLMKGGMRLASTPTSPGVLWRVPTKYDWHQAEVDGVRWVLRSQGVGRGWAQTVSVTIPSWAWFHNTALWGRIQTGARNDSVTVGVRCVGHPVSD